MAEPDLITRAIAAAKTNGLRLELLERAPALGRTHADALVEVHYANERLLYAAEVKRTVNAATLGATVHDLKRLGEQVLLITDYVSPTIADQLRQHRIAFLDIAGNAYLERPPLFVWIKGQKRPDLKAATPEIRRAFQPGGLQVLFTALCQPDFINRPYRELAAMAGVAHGTVGWVMGDLQQLGYVHQQRGKRGTRRLLRPRRLVTQWTEAYARLLRPRTMIGRYYIPTLEGWREWPLMQHEAMWGGEPGAALLTDHLRPGELTIYADKLPGLLAAQKKFLKDAAPGHAAVIDVRRRFWNFAGDPEHPDLVPPLLIYADLLATGDARCIETAGLVYDGYLARSFGQE